MRRRTLFAGLVALVLVLTSTVAQSTTEAPAAQILFARSANKDRVDLYVMAADGSKLRLLARDAGGATASPDGRRIAFERESAIWVMRRDGSGQRRLTKPVGGSQGSDRDPAWSPDGQTLYFSRARSWRAWIYAIRPDGTGLSRLTRAPSSACEEGPAPSPGGRLIAYDTWGDCEKSRDATITAVTITGHAAPLRFAFPRGDCVGPAWAPAPTATRLTYWCWDYSDVSGNVVASRTGIFVSATGYLPPRQLVRGDAHGPAWSPDGSTIAFWRDNGIWRISPDGEGLRRLKRTGGEPAWLPPVR